MTNKLNNYEWALPLFLVKEVKNTYYDYFKTYGDYKFETWLETLKQLCPKLPFLKVLEPLQINQYEDLILIRFGLAEMQDQGGEMWSNENSIYRECRSIVIDIRSEEVVVAPFRKFFNLNEVEENLIENIIIEIEKAKSVEFANKLDGSMQCATMYKGEVLLTGSMALTPKSSWRLEEGYRMLTSNHINMIKDSPFITFIFEFISLKDPHVVKYNKEQEGLYLIGMRNKNNGKQYSYKEIEIFSKSYGVPMTKIEDITIDQALKISRTAQSCDKEGWVLNVDGHMVKIKCDDYVMLHRTLDSISSVNVVIRAIAHDAYDDLISKIPRGHRDRVEEIAKVVYKYVNSMNKLINEAYSEICHIEDRVEAMKWININIHKDIQGFVRAKYDGQEFNVLKTRKYRTIKEINSFLECL